MDKAVMGEKTKKQKQKQKAEFYNGESAAGRLAAARAHAWRKRWRK